MIFRLAKKPKKPSGLNHKKTFITKKFFLWKASYKNQFLNVIHTQQGIVVISCTKAVFPCLTLGIFSYSSGDRGPFNG